MKHWKKILVTILVVSGLGLTTYYFTYYRGHVAEQNSGRVTDPAVQIKKATTVDSSDVIEMINIERARVGLTPLSYNPQLETVAQAKVADMVLHNYWGHDNPSNGRNKAWEIIDQNYPNKLKASENISCNLTSPSSIVQSWMDSPPHRQGLLDPEMRDVGVGSKVGHELKRTDGLGYCSDTVVVLFGTRM